MNTLEQELEAVKKELNALKTDLAESFASHRRTHEGLDKETAHLKKERDAALQEVEQLKAALEHEAVFGAHNLIPSYLAEIENLKEALSRLVEGFADECHCDKDDIGVTHQCEFCRARAALASTPQAADAVKEGK